MAFISLNIFSEALGMQTNVSVVLPQKFKNGEIGVKTGAKAEKLKCLYLLHGLSDDNTIWERRTSIERYATEKGLCVVMPCGGRSFYTDEKYGLKYYTYVAKELPTIIEETFYVSNKSQDRFIGGNSMGGYGAIKIALKERGRYAAAFGLSSVANIHNENFSELLRFIHGGEIPDEDDLFKLADMREQDEGKPKLYITVGKDDFMYLDNVAFGEYMQKKNYDFTYVETDGGHSWELWDKTVQDAISWMLR